MYNDIKEVAKQPALLVSIAPFINPVTVGIGIAGLFLYALIKDDKDKPEKEPLSDSAATKKPTVQPLMQPLAVVPSTVEPAVENYRKDSLLAIEPSKEEAFKKEAIRQHMSALGKKSAAERARKKQNTPYVG